MTLEMLHLLYKTLEDRIATLEAREKDAMLRRIEALEERQEAADSYEREQAEH